MPRASDPSLFGQQLPITHSPLSRIDYRFRKPEMDVGDLMEGAKKFVEDYLFPVIEDLTGIDLSAFLPLLDLLNLDFSSPTAFFQSLINSILLLPEIVLLLINTLVEQLINAPETFAAMISGLITLLATLPTMLTELGNALLTSAAGMLGTESPLDSLKLFNLIPTDIMSHIPMSNIGEFVTNMLTDPNFLDPSSIPGWLHDLTGGFGGTGTRYTTANGTLKELFGNLIPVSEGQTVPLSAKAKWSGLSGNLVPSPSFEDPSVPRIYNSYGGGGGYNTTQAHSGTHSFLMVSQAGAYNDYVLLPENSMPVQPGQQYLIESWIYAPTSNTGTHVMNYAAFTDSKGVLGVNFANTSDAYLTKGVWTKLSGTCTVPAGYDTAKFNVSLRNDNTTGDAFYIDDVVVSKVGGADPVQLAITGYKNGAATLQQIIASHNMIPPTTDWLTLSGNFTVPANVDSIRTRLVVAPAAASGTVYFSKASATKVGTMLQRLISGQNPGETITNDIENLFGGIITNATELLNKAGLGDFNDLVSTIGGDFGDDLVAAEQRLEDFLNSLSPLNGSNINTGTISDAHIPTIPEIRDAVVTTVGNLAGGNFDITKMLEVLTGQTHAIVDNGAGITNMFARLSNLESRVSALPVSGGGTGSGTASGGAVGVIDTDNFERVSSSGLGSLWIPSYRGGDPSGVWATPNGHDATWNAFGVVDREFLMIRNNPAVPRSQTDYQRVTCELSSKATRFYDAILGTYNYCGFDDIWLRISDATTSLSNITGIRIRYGGDGGLTIHRFIAGAGTLMAGLGTGGITPPGPGAQMIGEAGVLADGALRTFRAKIGESIRLQITETGTASGLGATCRRWGHGGLAEGHALPLPGQEKPGGLHYFTAMDQTL